VDPALLSSKLTYTRLGRWYVTKFGHDQSEWDMIGGRLIASANTAAIASAALGTAPAASSRRHTRSAVRQQWIAGMTLHGVTRPTVNESTATWTALPVSCERHRAERDEGGRSGATEDTNRSVNSYGFTHR
jgi:hypothetical protein